MANTGLGENRFLQRAPRHGVHSVAAQAFACGRPGKDPSLVRRRYASDDAYADALGFIDSTPTAESICAGGARDHLAVMPDRPHARGSR